MGAPKAVSSTKFQRKVGDFLNRVRVNRERFLVQFHEREYGGVVVLLQEDYEKMERELQLAGIDTTARQGTIAR